MIVYMLKSKNLKHHTSKYALNLVKKLQVLGGNL